jgi:hypothetical protein
MLNSPRTPPVRASMTAAAWGVDVGIDADHDINDLAQVAWITRCVQTGHCVLLRTGDVVPVRGADVAGL